MCRVCQEVKTQIVGNDLNGPLSGVTKVEHCQAKCQGEQACSHYTWNGPSQTCQLKTAATEKIFTLGKRLYTHKLPKTGARVVILLGLDDVRSGPKFCGPTEACHDLDYQYTGTSISTAPADHSSHCQDTCHITDTCTHWTFDTGTLTCRLMSAKGARMVSTASVSGPKECNLCHEYFTTLGSGNAITASAATVNGITSANLCRRECQKVPECQFFTWEEATAVCNLKTSDAGRTKDPTLAIVSGPKVCIPEGADPTTCVKAGIKYYKALSIVSGGTFETAEACREHSTISSGGPYLYYTYEADNGKCTRKNAIHEEQNYPLQISGDVFC